MITVFIYMLCPVSVGDLSQLMITCFGVLEGYEITGAGWPV